MLRVSIIVAVTAGALLVGGCAHTGPSQERARREETQDRQEERVRALQDEFNRSTGDDS